MQFVQETHKISLTFQRTLNMQNSTTLH